MIPRKKLDIGWSDLFYGIRACVTPPPRFQVAQQVEAAWSPRSDAVACLSVRSGFDLVLNALNLPRGSEVLVSAITIHDMVRIIEAHGLVPVPVDMNMETLAVDCAALRRAISPATRAILVAHLFGSRMPLDDVAEIARAYGLVLIEDCAQAYAQDNFRGHPACDVSMFSFGPVKTSTALGGALLNIRDSALRSRVRLLQAEYPVLSIPFFRNRLFKYVGLKLLTYRLTFGAFRLACQLAGKSHDAVIGASLRGFPGPDFIEQIRQQPNAPLLALLLRRLGHADRKLIQQRVAAAERAIRELPQMRRPGECAVPHTYWIFPVLVKEPDRLKRYLWEKGFDATRGASNLEPVAAPNSRPETVPVHAQHATEQILYLPVYPQVAARDVRRLARALEKFEQAK